MMLAWKISPLLAAGNTVILKPAQVINSHLLTRKPPRKVYRNNAEFSILHVRPGETPSCLNKALCCFSYSNVVTSCVVKEH